MRRKTRAKKPSQGGVEENAPTCFKTKENTLLGGTKQPDNLSKNPAGRGLGKAGAKRLGRLLKRVIQPQEEPAGKGKASLPKTPVRLFKHQIETEANNAPKAKSSKEEVSKVILSVVSQCKHRGGISMAQLKQTLAAEGYDVAKKKRQVNVVTERLLNNETLVRATRNTSFRLNNKKVMETTAVKVNTAKPPKPTRELRGKTAANKSLEGATRAQKTHTKTQKARDRIQILKGSTSRGAGKSQKQRRQARKSRKPARKKPRLTKNRTTRAQRPPAKAKKALRHQPKQVKSSRRKRPQRRPKTSSRLQTQQRRNTKRRTQKH